MHHIYHTEGIILGSKNFGEAGKYYSIFTRELGLVHASAQGVRKLSSKLRYILQDYACVRADLVRGKDFWRVTSASKISGLEALAQMPPHLRIFGNVSRLLRRLLSGEEPNEALFDDFKKGLLLLQKTKTEDLPDIEAVLVLRILHNLGYIGESPGFEDLTKSPFEEGLVLQAYKNRRAVLRQINKALKETHL